MTTTKARFQHSVRFATTLGLSIACGALALLWPGWMTAMRAQAAYDHINIISGQSQSGPSGTPLSLPFVVQLDEPVSERTITWSVSSGGGSLTDGSTTHTDSLGRSTNRLVVGSVRSITVTATLVGGNTVTFIATCSSCEDDHHTSTPAADAAIAGLKQLGQLAPTAVTTTKTQITNVGLRLLNLRRGGSALSAGGLSLNIDGETAPVGLAATQMFSLFSKGGGASADASPFGNLGVFVNGLGTFGDQRSSSREPGFDFHSAGVTVGADYRVIPQLVLGAAFGYASTKGDFDASAGEMRTNGYSVSGYGGLTLGQFHLDAILTYGWNDYSTERNILGTGVTAKGSPDGNQFAVSMNTGYDFNFGALTVGPSVRVNYIDVEIDKFSERGGGDFSLRVKRQTTESLTTSLGGEVSYAISTPFGVLTPLIRFEWEHEYKSGSRLVAGTLVTDPSQTPFSVRTDNPDRDYFNLGAGLTGTFRSGVSAFFYYETILGRSRVTNHSLTMGLRFEF